MYMHIDRGTPELWVNLQYFHEIDYTCSNDEENIRVPDDNKCTCKLDSNFCGGQN